MLNESLAPQMPAPEIGRINVMKVLSTVITAVDVIKEVAKFVVILADALEIDVADISELGDKVLQSGLQPEDFDNYEKYWEAVQKYELDFDKSGMISESDKLIAGIGAVVGRLESQITGIADLVSVVIKDFAEYMATNGDKGYFSPERMIEFGRTMIQNKEMIPDITAFLKGNLNDAGKFSVITEIFKEVEQTVHPELPSSEVLRNLSRIGK